MKTYRKLIKELEEANVTPQIFCEVVQDNYYPEDEEDEDEKGPSKEAVQKIIGKYEIKEEKGGEGEGEHWSLVVFLKEHDVYIRVDAYYQSYEGTDFSDSDFEEVKPKTKTVTVYE